LKRDMAVITADGVVGKVLLVYPSVSQVLLINDQSSGVGALLEKTRLQGVLRGTANGEIVLERVMSDEQVPVGEAVLTSGGDQIFPKGLPIGTVAKVGTGKDLFLSIKVKSSANLSKLEEVLVLVEKQEREATAEGTGHTRAADILAQRLPSIPDKPLQPANAVAPGSATESAKPGASATAGPKPANLAVAPGRNSAMTGNTSVVPGAGQPGTVVMQKAGATSGSAATGSKLPVSPGKPADTQPAQAKPSTQPSTPPANPKTPADQDSPN